MKFRKKKAIKVLGMIAEAYTSETHLYKYCNAKNGDAPQHRHIPKGVGKGSREHLMYLFFANLLTYHSQSEQGFLQVKRVYEKQPEMFHPSIVLRERESVCRVLTEVGFIYPNEGGRRWHLSAEALFRYYAGDPLKIFQQSKSIDGLLEKVKHRKGRNLFVGLGPKLFSLLALFYEELGVINHIRGAFPVDIHVQAECIGLHLVDIGKRIVSTTPIAEFLRPRIWEVCRREGMSALDLSHAMWFLGNRVCYPLCHKKPAQAEVLCPVWEHCDGRISTKLYSTRGKWGYDKKFPLFDTT